MKITITIENYIFMKFKYIIPIFAAAFVCSCGDKKDASKAIDPVVEVKLATVNTESIPQTEVYTATVESDLKNNISPNMSYRIERILVDVGDQVSKGQLLVQLDASSLNQLKLQIDNQKVEFNRINELYKVGGASKAEFDNAKMQIEVMESQYRQMSQNTQLFAPMSGVVTARNYDNGDMYAGTPILTIEKTNPVKVIMNVSEIHYKSIKKGQSVDLVLDSYEGENFTGKVTTISPSIDITTHTFPVEVTINNPQQKVRPGMFARVTVNYGSQSHVLVPDEALVKQIGAGDRYVYVYNAKTSTVSYNKIQLGQHIGTKYEILSGVEDGQQVVIAGQARLAEGKKVKVVK